jgi:hypothetical protein
MSDYYNKNAFEQRFDSESLALQKALLNKKYNTINSSKRAIDTFIFIVCVVGLVALTIGVIRYGW